ncbi:MAG: tetraacyldisaccharide 4'-kinase [Tahibacter sp.]
MARADRFDGIWYGGAPIPLSLRLLAWLYARLGAFRRSLYRRGWLESSRLRVPVIVVGNISVGGTGKTPLTIAMVEALQRRGIRVGVVSRGYGGSATAPVRVAMDSAPELVGDEPVLIRQRTGAVVVVGRDRVEAAQLLLQDPSIQLIIADDGLQHYRLRRDIEICVIDGARRFGNRRLLPAGPLREPVSRLTKVDFKVCNGGLAQVDEVLLRLMDDGAQRVVDPQQRIGLEMLAGGRVHGVAGIGNPTRFFESLRARRIEVIEHAFPDHHAYTAADLEFGDNLPLLMTEKDAVKCRGFARDNWWCLPVRAQLPETFFDALVEKLHALPTRQTD